MFESIDVLGTNACARISYSAHMSTIPYAAHRDDAAEHAARRLEVYMNAQHNVQFALTLANQCHEQLNAGYALAATVVAASSAPQASGASGASSAPDAAPGPPRKRRRRRRKSTPSAADAQVML